MRRKGKAKAPKPERLQGACGNAGYGSQAEAHRGNLVDESLNPKTERAAFLPDQLSSRLVSLGTVAISGHPSLAAHPLDYVQFRANGSHQLSEADPVKRAAYLGIGRLLSVVSLNDFGVILMRPQVLQICRGRVRWRRFSYHPMVDCTRRRSGERFRPGVFTRGTSPISFVLTTDYTDFH